MAITLFIRRKNDRRAKLDHVMGDEAEAVKMGEFLQTAQDRFQIGCEFVPDAKKASCKERLMAKIKENCNPPNRHLRLRRGISEHLDCCDCWMHSYPSFAVFRLVLKLPGKSPTTARAQIWLSITSRSAMTSRSQRMRR